MITTRAALRRQVMHRELEIDRLRAKVDELEQEISRRDSLPMTREEALRLRDKLAETPDPTCQHCGGLHSHKCWRVKIAMHDGSVTYWKDWDKSTTVWPEEVLAVVMATETNEN